MNKCEYFQKLLKRIKVVFSHRRNNEYQARVCTMVWLTRFVFVYCDAKYRYVNEDSPSLLQFLMSLGAFYKA